MPNRSAAPWIVPGIESLRLYQWLKNGLVFVPLAAAHRLTEWNLLGASAQAFIAFSLCASSIYVLNDLWDASADRQHPHKRNRPIASGRLTHSPAVGISLTLFLSALAIALRLGPAVAGVIGFYFALMVTYSLQLKAIVLLDAMTLAGGYALRVVAGALAVRIWPSPWLLAFCIFFFFSLALMKRYAELAVLRRRDGAAAHARAYLLEDQEFLVALGTACGVAAVLVLALYASSNLESPHRDSQFLWLTCIFLLYWISHMWLAAHRGFMTDDPLVFALRNRVSQVLIVLMGITAWLTV
jgi:4-hydroxybenzoate polyprenyltransferase